MIITISKEVSEKLGIETFREWGVKKTGYFETDNDIDLRAYDVASLSRLLKIFTDSTGVPGSRDIVRDLRVWIASIGKDLSTVKCQTARNFETFLLDVMKPLEKKWLYQKDSRYDCWRAFYVYNIKFTPKKPARGDERMIPAHVDVSMAWDQFGATNTMSQRWWEDDVRGLTALECLNKMGFVLESPELDAEYHRISTIYAEARDKVGRQYLGRGSAIIQEMRTHGSYSSSYAVNISMDKSGTPSQVVIDVDDEGEEKKSRNRGEHVSDDFWNSKNVDKKAQEEGEVVEKDDVLMPIFPLVTVFDLRRHAHLETHMMNLERYVYNKTLADKLILPEDVRGLISLLVSDTSDFQDIIKGKGGGAVILCSGPPGCGKTLTSEVYAEVMERPLYSVQCSQLGTDEEELEKTLQLVLTRATRWNAILLLDEADVYVATRGSSIQQNAIVGVFLRVLEYYSGVLFMTTNRSNLVDDAITSRCLARIDYKVPTREDQMKIWRILSQGCGATISDEVIHKVAHTWPALSGRDVKQLTKLAAKVAASRNETEITFEIIKFVKTFKPTPGDGRLEIAKEDA